IGLIVVLGLISAGLSTLESLIQSISTTVTNDIIKPLASPRLGLDRPENFRVVLLINRAVIILLALAAFMLSWQQLVDPKLSVSIFAQNGVYAYFSAAFVPILMGMFLRDVPLVAPVAASLTAVTVHFSMYYGRLPLPFTLADGENPGVAAAVAIVASVVVGFGIYLLGRGRRAPAPLNRVGGSAR
ncbi:MAG: sodium:solute symporter, partial [Gammaproteobacteria bacterium]|nr:sodium:solute symporter [Gammaproteobacteria bacterium]